MNDIFLLLATSFASFIGGCFYGLNINVRSQVREIAKNLPINIVAEKINSNTWVAQLMSTNEFICQSVDYDTLIQMLYEKFPERQIVVTVVEVLQE
jgi:hypothetical protein